MKKFRFWLAGKILGAKIQDYEEIRKQWIKEQLDRGEKVYLEFIVEEKPVVH